MLLMIISLTMENKPTGMPVVPNSFKMGQRLFSARKIIAVPIFTFSLITNFLERDDTDLAHGHLYLLLIQSRFSYDGTYK